VSNTAKNDGSSLGRYKLSNQSFAGLRANAGKEVMLTGEMKGESITVSKVAPPENK
jgi:hypothetical protein